MRITFSNRRSDTMATFGYGRVSTAEQTTENQRIEIEQAGVQLDYWYADTVSGAAHATQRAEFNRMLDKLRRDDVLVVTKLDRLGRDAVDVLATIRRLEQLEVKVIVLQLGQLDLTSPAGRLMLTMLAAVAEMERDLLIERTRAGLERARAEGKTLGRPPKTTHKAREAMVTAHQQGTTISALARAYGVSRATVLSIVAPREPDQVARQDVAGHARAD
jgi:DNA invertase Pin-like site-specific DNA recombinase